MCGDEVPVPEEECEAESLATCTSFLTINAAFQMSCVNESVKETEVPDDVTTGFDVAVSNGSGGEQDGGMAEDSDEITLDEDEEIDLEPKQPEDQTLDEQEVYEPTVWDIVDCCEDMAAPDSKEMIECVLELEDGDCEGFQKCGGYVPGLTAPNGDDVWETIGLDKDAEIGERDDGSEQSAAGADEEASSPSADESSGTAAEADDADEEGSDSSCSAVPTIKGAKISLFTLVLSLFS
jgi:hypothetical protein